MSTPTDMTSMSPLPLSNEALPTQLESGSSPTVLSSSLPYPDPFSLNISPGQKKKSHARKQPAGHIPRPRNAFILFRCDFVRQKKVPDHLEANHRNISRIVGSVWKKMSASQKAPWIAMANIEKKNHAEAHPGYKYHPGYESRGRDARIRKINQSPAEGVSPARTPSPSFTPPLAPLRRSSSCPPPGAFPVLGNSSLGLTQAKMLGISAPSMTKDDLARRPSRTIMYQSTAPLFPFGHQPTDPTPASAGNGLSSAQWWATDPGSGSPLTTGPYTIAPPGDAPGWDAAPTKADTWYPWSEGNVGPHTMGHMDVTLQYE
ncbi:hypothetical protein DFJ43DRAFT_759659 [Lentinula guzmanii]|uniref:HMG box domain-containing protein n=1 Tax=Lentinula guzmanii TaxID=2804957 RepID=A0AA38JEU3_9AGAR|nr:hypothetical protein DFJ43DRAFT_759659 [Lentinula guzmanii]